MVLDIKQSCDPADKLCLAVHREKAVIIHLEFGSQLYRIPEDDTRSTGRIVSDYEVDPVF